MSTKTKAPCAALEDGWQILGMNGNAARVAAVQDLRRSGAAGSHSDRRNRRNRDRSAQRRNAIRDAS